MAVHVSCVKFRTTVSPHLREQRDSMSICIVRKVESGNMFPRHEQGSDVIQFGFLTWLTEAAVMWSNRPNKETAAEALFQDAPKSLRQWHL